MKTENTLDKKVKFFSQYWGLNVVNFRGKTITVHCAIDEKPIAESFLELKPLESISDDDATQCWVNDNYIPKSEDIKFVANLFNPITAINADYLRSKGYAISWMDLSVEDLIDYGWIKLVE